jgi:hypothetical protein
MGLEGSQWVLLFLALQLTSIQTLLKVSSLKTTQNDKKAKKLKKTYH